MKFLFFSGYYSKLKKHGWFRLFGYGLKFKNINYNGLIFSERNGYSKYIIVNNWLISFLKKY